MGAPSRSVRVEFLWWEGCPSWERALSELREQMAAVGLDPRSIRLVPVETDGDVERLGFVGSPTIRVEGTDVQPPGDRPSGLTCRVYHLRDGRISALPDPGDVGDALREAIGGGADG